MEKHAGAIYEYIGCTYQYKDMTNKLMKRKCRGNQDVSVCNTAKHSISSICHPKTDSEI